MFQLSQMSDRVMNRLSRKIGKAVEKITEGEREKEEAWTQVKDLFAEHGKEAGPKARFIASDGFTIKWTKRPGKTKLNPDLLFARLVDAHGVTAADNIWRSITDRTISPEKLEAAVNLGTITEELLKPCIETGEDIHPRLREEWSKEDKERAVIFGISTPDK